MAFIPAVGGADHEQIAKGQHVAIASFMWKDAQGRHIQLPDDVCCTLVCEDLFPIWTIVLTIVETVRIEATEVAIGGDVGTTGRLQQMEHLSSKATATP